MDDDTPQPQHDAGHQEETDQHVVFENVAHLRPSDASEDLDVSEHDAAQVPLNVSVPRSSSNHSNVSAHTPYSTRHRRGMRTETLLKLNVLPNVAVRGGLTSAEATKMLHEGAERSIALMDSERWNVIRQALRQYFSYPSTYIYLLFVLVLFAAFACKIAGVAVSNPQLKDKNYTIDSQENGAIRVLVEAIVLLLSFIVNVILHCKLFAREKIALFERLRTEYKEFKRTSFSVGDIDTDSTLSLSTGGLPLIHVCRDNKWTRTLPLFLVRGDLIYFNPVTNLPRPTIVQQNPQPQPDGSTPLAAGTSQQHRSQASDSETKNTWDYCPADDLPFRTTKHRIAGSPEKEGFYIVEENVLEVHIKAATETSIPLSKDPLQTRVNIGFNILTGIACGALAIIWIYNAIRVGLDYANYDWVDLLLLDPVYVCIFVIPMLFPMYWWFCDAIGAAKLYTLMDTLNKKENATRIGSVSLLDKETPIDLPASDIFKHFWQIVKASNDHLGSVSVTHRPLLALGATTALCFVDKEGLISDLYYVPEKIMLMKPPSASAVAVSPSDTHQIIPQNLLDHEPDSEVGSEPIAREHTEHQEPIEQSQDEMIDQNNTDAAAADVVVDPNSIELGEMDVMSYMMYQQQQRMIHEAMKDTAVILDLVRDDSSTNQIRFQDSNWQNFMDSLKPIGLNCLVTTACDLPYVDNDCLCDDTSSLWKHYLYLLGKEIGFSDSVLTGFRHLRRIHTQRPMPEHMEDMSSLVILDDRSSSMQLLSHGNPDLLLEYCSDYYDGADVRPLTDEVRQNVKELFERWRDRRDYFCLAMAYKPVEERYFNFLLDEETTLSTEHHNASSSTADHHHHNNRVVHVNVGMNVSNNQTPAGSQHNEMSEGSLSVEDLSTLASGPHFADPASARLHTYENMQKGQIFIGMVALRKMPKREIPALIEDLGDAGIRFIFLSSQNEQKTKAFGEKLGLETTWNCCISLEDDKDRVELDEADLKARLPHGIDAIRDHIKNVDNVPLLVSMFCDTSTQTTQQMLSVLQENEEVVCCVGASTKVENIPLFAQGNSSVCVDPAPDHAIPLSLDGEEMEQEREHYLARENARAVHMAGIDSLMAHYQRVLSLIGFSSVLRLTQHSTSANHQSTNNNICGWNSFAAILQLLKEARRMLTNKKQSIMLLVAMNLFCQFLLLLSVMLLIPTQMLNGVQILWLQLVIFPIISLSILGTPMDRNIMNIISSKNRTKTKSYFLSLGYFFLRYSLTICMCIVIYVWVFTASYESSAPVSGSGGVLLSWDAPFGGRLPIEAYATVQFSAAINYAQSIVLFFIVYYWIFASMGLMHRAHSLVQAPPFRNKVWVVSCIAALLLQLAYSALYILLASPVFPSAMPWPALPFYAYIIFFAWPIVSVLIDEAIRSRFRKSFLINQKRLKLHFNTKLGMHSPV